MLMAADTEVKDFTKELEVKEPATITISGEARVANRNSSSRH
jgi:hypothetical protein